jgi:hypothetical protein
MWLEVEWKDKRSFIKTWDAGGNCHDGDLLVHAIFARAKFDARTGLEVWLITEADLCALCLCGR